jgi:aldose 1-epimerase
MSVKREFIGETEKGQAVYLFHITNKNDMEVTVLNYGINIQNVFVKDKNGNRCDVVLGFDDLEGYKDNKPTLGSTIGPSANRVEGGKYTIAGKEYHLPLNENGMNNLHTDFDNGFHKTVWDSEEGDNLVRFTYKAADGELGFPGNREFTVEVSLSDDNELGLHYHAESDADTLINVTNHTYFNLGGSGNGKILGHVLQLNSHYFTPVKDKGSIPSGEKREVKGTPLDFTTPKTIGQDINSDYEQVALANGYDHNFIIDGGVDEVGNATGEMREFAIVTNPVTGITMHASTNLPGFQFYSANFLKDLVGKNGYEYGQYDGLCLETQTYPNGVNTPSFPSPVYGPNRPYDAVTVYKFN